MRRMGNAFSEELLRLLETLDEFGSPPEAELAGPWKVLAVEGGFGLYEQWQDAEDAPMAVFKDRATALKFSAALSAASREPLFRQEPDPNPEGSFNVLSSQGRIEGWLPHFQDRTVDLAHMADYCARSPFALASILLAAGGPTLRKAGELLAQAVGEEAG